MADSNACLCFYVRLSPNIPCSNFRSWSHPAGRVGKACNRIRHVDPPEASVAPVSPLLPHAGRDESRVCRAVLTSTRSFSSHQTPVTSHRERSVEQRPRPGRPSPPDVSLRRKPKRHSARRPKKGFEAKRARQSDGVSQRLIAGTRQWGVRGFPPDAGTAADRHFRECVLPAPLNYAKGQIPCRFGNMHVIPLAAAADWALH